jgi:hypothetical protein
MLYSPVLGSRLYRKHGAGGGPVGTQMYGGGPIDAAVRATSAWASGSVIDSGLSKLAGTTCPRLDVLFFTMIPSQLWVQPVPYSGFDSRCYLS